MRDKKKSDLSIISNITGALILVAVGLMVLLLCIITFVKLGRITPQTPPAPIETEAIVVEETIQPGITLPESSSEIQRQVLPQYSGEDVWVVNGNIPYFTTKDITDKCFLKFTKLDKLGRCGEAYSCLGQELFPTEERGNIGMIKPSGWQTVRYDDIIADKYLYNRCHLIAYMFCGENANELNLITGTRYLNVSGMLPYENTVHSYIEQTGNHVLYRVTPVFDGKDLVAYGVLMEAYSVEDYGAGVCFNVLVYNIQPGIAINYSNGDSCAE